MLTPLTIGTVKPQIGVYSRLAVQLDRQITHNPPGFPAVYQTIWAAVCGESSAHIFREIQEPARLSS